MAPALPYIYGVMAATAVYGGVKADQMGRFNETVANNEAAYQKKKGAFEAKQHEDRIRKLVGLQTVQTAKAGVSLLSGSALDVYTDTQREALTDAALIRMGADSAAARAHADAREARATGQAGLISGISSAGKTLLTSGVLTSTPAPTLDASAGVGY